MNRKPTNHDEEYMTTPLNETEMDDIVNYPFSEVDLRLGRWDARRTYKIFDYVQVGEKFIQLSQDYQVCLATQSSVDRMHSIVEVRSLTYMSTYTFKSKIS